MVCTLREVLEPERTGSCALEQRWAFFRREGEELAQEKPPASERIEVSGVRSSWVTASVNS